MACVHVFFGDGVWFICFQRYNNATFLSPCGTFFRSWNFIYLVFELGLCMLPNIHLNSPMFPLPLYGIIVWKIEMHGTNNSSLSLHFAYVIWCHLVLCASHFWDFSEPHLIWAYVTQVLYVRMSRNTNRSK